jgi:malate dehydrogenase (oxaloacetate-decarboxylating)(NADP+)
MESGVARRPIKDLRRYGRELAGRLDTAQNTLDLIIEGVRDAPKRIVFAEGEDEKMVRAASLFHKEGFGTPVLIGREDRVRAAFDRLGLVQQDGIEIRNARLSAMEDRNNARYVDFLYARTQRSGFLLRDVQRMVNQDRNHFAACMVALGDADAMVTGVTRNFSVALEDVCRCIDPKPGHRVMGVSLVIARGRTVLVADTAVTEMPQAQDLADIAIEAAGVARKFGHEPRLALLAFSTFGHPPGERAQRVQEAVRILDQRRVDFEYDGEMAADIALNPDLMAAYPFCRLSGPANVLIMPAFHSAAISTKMLQELGGATVIGPLLVGLDRPVQIVGLSATDSELVNMAGLAAFNVGG